jgi:hypothetical protein
MSIKLATKSSKSSKSSKTYYCNFCDYTASQKSNYDKHLASKKHTKKCCENVADVAKMLLNEKSGFGCEFCNKEYKSRSGLWRHQQKCKCKDKTIEKSSKKVVKSCNSVDEKDNSYLEITQLKNQIIEMKEDKIKIQEERIKSLEKTNEKLTEICTQVARTNATTNNFNNCGNQNISIKVFLNENCKDALNLKDFVNNIKITLEDLAYTKDNGYINGVTNIIKKQLEDLKPTERPIHCSDTKRLKFYVKDNNIWEKDEDNKKLDETIRDVKLKQCKTITEWEKLNTTYKEDPKLMNEWQDIMSGISEGNSGNPKKEKIILKKKIGSCIDLKDAMENV